MASSVMRLTGMEFFAFHGCLDSEREQGNDFRVDFECEYDMDLAARTDDLRHAVNYAKIYDIVKEQMSVPSSLLENVAHRILSAVRRAFPSLEHASVTVFKLNPPVSGKCASSSVTMSF